MHAIDWNRDVLWIWASNKLDYTVNVDAMSAVRQCLPGGLCRGGCCRDLVGPEADPVLEQFKVIGQDATIADGIEAMTTGLQGNHFGCAVTEPASAEGRATTSRSACLTPSVRSFCNG